MNSTDKRQGWQRGWHGYDNELRDMRGIFLAFGPGRKTRPNSLSHSFLRKRQPAGADGTSRAGVISLWTLFMSKAEQTQPVSMKCLQLAGFQMLLGFGKRGQILFLVSFKSRAQ